MNSPTMRRQVADARNALHDVASGLDGLALSAGLAAVEIAAAAELVRKGMGRLTDALTHRLPGDGR